MCGIGAEIAQAINELAFDELDAPVGRLHTARHLAPVRAGAGAGDAGRRRRHRRRRQAACSPASRRCPTTGAPRPAGCRRCRQRRRRPAGRSPQRSRSGAPPLAEDEAEIVMPFGDLTVSEGRLVGWLKAVGDGSAPASSSPRSRPTRRWSRSRRRPPGTLAAIEQPVGAVVPMGGRIGRHPPGS